MAPDDLELQRSLLDEAPAEDTRRWAYPTWLMVVVSIFIAYHTAILLVWNTPNKHLGQKLHRVFNENLQMDLYMHAIGSQQSWAMFAPNPHQTNLFMKVLVVDEAGETWDLAHDVYKRRSYPYVFYDRMGKINRRLVEQKGYRRHYAAWVCREWERTHGGASAKEVRFVKLWTRIPPPHVVIRAAGWNLGAMWFDPDRLPLNETEEETVVCRNTRNGQLPDALRERYGLPPGKNRFLPMRMRTWRDVEEQKARREAQASRAAKGGAPR